ncbi:MAG: hypothetical protein DMD78_17720 [Candidatus Rokuibacteriota bacterium]|nr:MAG: hypothetical protein DMD78_17720 [Candidatus Rokubacteria bacterium]
MKTYAWILAVILSAGLLSAGVLQADESQANHRAIRLLSTIPIPPNVASNSSMMVVFDISWVDPETQRYYLADRSNAVIDVIDARHDAFIKQISGNFKGFTGSNDTSGPNGVVVGGRWLFVTDANSRVVSIDLQTDTIADAVSTGGAAGLRSDELAYDPKGGVLLVVNNADSPPFATLISVNKANGHLTVGQRITFTDATNGAEQPVWNPTTGLFYVSIPEVNGPGGTGQHGAVARINPKTGVEVLPEFPVDFCQPAGLALGPKQDLLLGCSVVFDTLGGPWTPADVNTAAPQQIIMDAKSGKIDSQIPGVGGSDEVWFNSGDGRYYTASRANPAGPVLGVIDAKSQHLVQVVPTFNTPASAPAPRGTAHSVAVNPHNNHVFVPLPANNVFPNCLTGCIAVYGTPKGDDDD